MYNPNPVDTSKIELPQELLELTEKIAENVHENWSAARMAEGWTYGEKRDDLQKTTPCLVSYSALPEIEKEYDRTTALQTLKLIVALGYRIEKIETEKEFNMKNAAKYIESFKIKHETFLLACESIEDAGLWDKELLGEMDSYYSNDMTSVIIRLIAADGKITEKEVEYLNRTFDFDYTLEELQEVYRSCRDNIGEAFDEQFENGISYMRKINSKLANAYKELLVLICEIIMNSDGVIAPAEIAEIQRLKELCL